MASPPPPSPTEDIAHMRIVRTGAVDAGMTAIEGIGPGTVVATSSFEKLHDNAPVVTAKKLVPARKGEADTP